MGDPLKKHNERVMQKANADFVNKEMNAHAASRGVLVPQEPLVMAPIPEREGDPAFLRRSVDALEWDIFKRCVPGGDKYEAAVESVCDRICDPATSVAEVTMLSDSLTNLTREIVKGILAVKTKQAEKPVTMNTQVNVDTSAFPLTRDAGRRALRGPRKTEPATTDSSAPSPPSESSDHAATSHPD